MTDKRPAKRAKFLVDLSGDSDLESDQGVSLNNASNSFTINEEYAKRFEHNKKREEKQRLEEKYGDAVNGKARRSRDGGDADDDDDSSSDESEDSNAELVTEDVDEEWNATLQAIKTKDPRVYDANSKFYRDFDPAASSNEVKKEKPMYLQDYHRENLLAGRGAGGDEGLEEDVPHVPTYQEEQDELKRKVVGSMHAAGNDEESGGDNDFMVPKSRPKHDEVSARTKTKAKHITEHDIKAADKDPETFLSNFMAARAWLPTDGSRPEAFDSDDSDEDKRADEFEEAYNMRFEDPKTANEKLQSFARDVGKYGVRRDEKSGRAKGREREKEQKEAAKREREEDKARLRKLKIEEVEEKVKRIKEAAGLHGQNVNLDEWKDVIEGDFDDDAWETEMQRRFGDEYYAAEDDGEIGLEDDQATEIKKKIPKKPKWDDDIDIDDLVPEFTGKQDSQFTLSDEDGEATGLEPSDETHEGTAIKKGKTKKDREKEKSEAKRAARKERQKIEEMVDSSLPLQNPALTSAATSRAPVVGFRYRETSPTTFGMSARDILFADDAQLNQFAGLKKLHAFRDSERKLKDRQKLGKKQRLQKWRKETFGKSSAPQGGFERVLGGLPIEEAKIGEEHATGSNVTEGPRKRKRKNKDKTTA